MRISKPYSAASGQRPSRLGLILILSLTSGSLASIGAVWWYYTMQSHETKAAMGRQLFAVAQGKSEQITNWRHERMADARMMMSSGAARIVRRVLGNRVADTDLPDVSDYMSRLESQFLYSNITLTDLDGKVTVRLHDETTVGDGLRQPLRKELAREAVRAGDVVFSDLRPDVQTGRPMMALTVPVGHSGALILDIDPARFLYPCLESWPGSSRTGETLLARLEGNELVTLSKRRNAPNSALFSRRHINTHPSEALLEAGWSIEDVDYRGVPAFGTIRHIPDSPWYLICKMDIAEVEAPLRRLGWEMALVTALIAVANAAGVVLIWRGRQSRIRQEQEAWYYAIANDTPAYLWMAMASSGNSFVNQPLSRFLGTDQQLLSQGLTDYVRSTIKRSGSGPPKNSLNGWTGFVHPDDAVRLRETFLEGIRGGRGYSVEFRLRRFDGSYRWVVVEAVPRFSDEGEFMGLAGSLADITDRRHAEEGLRSANAALARQLDDAIRKEQEIEALGSRLIGAQEEERKRLARELHDDLNQEIAVLSIAMGNLKRRIPRELSEARSQSDEIHQKLVHVAETVRRMSHELHPAILQYSGLAATLQSYSQEFGTLTGIRVSLTIEGNFDGIPLRTALGIYRIVQEALRNVAKHAQVASAVVELRHAGGTLNLTISDAGVGMESPASEAQAGLGLVSMRERAKLAGGTLEIVSKPGAGTTVRLRIPT